MVGKTVAFLRKHPDVPLEPVEFCITDRERFGFFRRELDAVRPAAYAVLPSCLAVANMKSM